MKMIKMLTLCGVMGVFGSHLWAAAAPRYSLTLIPTLGGQGSDATAINDLGQVVGNSTLANGDSRGYLYDNGTLTPIGDSRSYASGINNLGQITGTIWIDNETRMRAYRTELDGSMTDLSAADGKFAGGREINDLGEVIGTTETGGPLGFWADPDGTRTDLGLFGAERAYATDLNNTGQALFWTYTGPTPSTVLVQRDHSFTTISVPGASQTTANGTNDLGQIVGSRVVDGEARAYRLNPDGTVTVLGTLGESSWAEDITDSGYIVGGYSLDGNQRPFVYHDDFGMIDLFDLLEPYEGTLTQLYVRDINESGQIVGRSGSRGFLLTPVPEPAALSLLALTLPLLLRRRSNCRAT